MKQWSKAGAFFESNNDLFTCLKSSLDALDNKLKECYIDLGAFPEGQLIPASAIIDMWEELYEMNGDGLNSISNLHELSSLNLIDLVDTRYAGFIFVIRLTKSLMLAYLVSNHTFSCLIKHYCSI